MSPADERIKTHLECAVPLLDDIVGKLHAIGLKKMAGSLREVGFLLQDCLNALAQSEKA